MWQQLTVARTLGMCEFTIGLIEIAVKVKQANLSKLSFKLKLNHNLLRLSKLTTPPYIFNSVPFPHVHDRRLQMTVLAKSRPWTRHTNNKTNKKSMYTILKH